MSTRLKVRPKLYFSFSMNVYVYIYLSLSLYTDKIVDGKGLFGLIVFNALLLGTWECNLKKDPCAFRDSIAEQKSNILILSTFPAVRIPVG